MSLKHKTTIEYHIGIGYGYLNVDDVIREVNNLKDYLLEKKDAWGFEFQMDDKIHSEADEINKIFNDFNQFLKKNAFMGDGEETSYINFSDFGKYVIDFAPRQQPLPNSFRKEIKPGNNRVEKCFYQNKFPLKKIQFFCKPSK